MDNIIYMGYIDNNYYLNNKKNIINNIFLKRKIYINNKDYILKKLNTSFIVNDIELDNNQKEAIFSDEVNTLVLSGAGSGKTLTIAGKIKYLVEEKGVKEKEILCLSFTNEAVNNLKDKVKYDVDIFTFHKLAVEIINDYKLNISIMSNYLEYIIDEIFLSIIENIDEKTLKYFNNSISSFINLFKNYDFDINYFNKITKKNKSKLLELTKRIYLLYEEELKSSNYIDFNDLINYSIELINNRGLKRYYKYIIIDEFQDISDNRYRLIKTIRESCFSKIFAVGDDYQSIYRFSGSNINMILNFKKYFGYSNTIRITNTYRNSNELIKVASSFIMKNRYQIRKKIVSNKHINKPVKIVYYSKNMGIKLKKLLDILEEKVMIIGRNNFDVDYILDEEIKCENGIIIYNNKEYKYKSVHKSKGLEEDYIILLNLNNSIYGFPNRKNKDISSLLMEKDKYLYEEERRLFYVALTRTRNDIYLFVDRDNPSIFVNEILRNSKKYIEVLDL